MIVSDIIQIANWVRAELQNAEDKGDVVSRIDAIRRVQIVLNNIDLGSDGLSARDREDPEQIVQKGK